MNNSISGIVMTSPEAYNYNQSVENGRITVCFELGFDRYGLCYPQTLVLLDVPSVAIAREKLLLSRKVTCYGCHTFEANEGQSVFQAKCVSVKKKPQKPVHKRILELRHTV